LKLPVFSDIYLLVAFWTGITALFLTLILAAEIVWLRYKLRRRQRSEQRTIGRWRPVMAAASVGVQTDPLPNLRSWDYLPYLKLWTHLQASMRGEAAEGLNTLARRMQADAIARKLFRKGNRAEGLLANLVAGYLRDAEAWPHLVRRIDSRDGTESIYAAWAMIQINPAQAAPLLIPAAIGRDDWPMSKLVLIMQDGGNAVMTPFVEALDHLGGAGLQRALRIAEGLRVYLHMELHERLLDSDDIDIVISALRVPVPPNLLPRIRALAAHADWRIRLHAARTLGSIGELSDVELLKGLLSDRQWWVRYRAAEALSALPFLTVEQLRALGDACSDPYAGSMVRQVLAKGALN
jgi:hypothetical protein